MGMPEEGVKCTQPGHKGKYSHAHSLSFNTTLPHRHYLCLISFTFHAGNGSGVSGIQLGMKFLLLSLPHQL